MIFVEKMEVIYKDMVGVIDFICDAYVVIQLPPADSSRSPARLVVYRSDYKKINLLKDSTK